MFVPVEYIVANGVNTPIKLLPVSNELFQSSIGHFGAIGINVLVLISGCISIFMFKKRERQIKLCYLIVVLNIVLILMLAFCPFIILKDNLRVQGSLFGYFIFT